MGLFFEGRETFSLANIQKQQEKYTKAGPMDDPGSVAQVIVDKHCRWNQIQISTGHLLLAPLESIKEYLLIKFKHVP